jgi:uncharacterized protein DUF6632
MTNDSRLRLLKGFLRIYGWLSLTLFSVLMVGFIVQPASWEVGGRWHWLIWDSVTDPVAPMLIAVYIVWSIFIIRAARDPMANKMFLEFTAWANVAHGISMVPHALMASEYHIKFLTDIPMVLLPAIALWLLRPSSTERQFA